MTTSHSVGLSYMELNSEYSSSQYYAHTQQATNCISLCLLMAYNYNSKSCHVSVLRRITLSYAHGSLRRMTKKHHEDSFSFHKMDGYCIGACMNECMLGHA